MITSMIFSKVGAKVIDPQCQAVDEGYSQLSTGKR